MKTEPLSNKRGYFSLLFVIATACLQICRNINTRIWMQQIMTYPKCDGQFAQKKTETKVLSPTACPLNWACVWERVLHGHSRNTFVTKKRGGGDLEVTRVHISVVFEIMFIFERFWVWSPTSWVAGFTGRTELNAALELESHFLYAKCCDKAVSWRIKARAHFTELLHERPRWLYLPVIFHG